MSKEPFISVLREFGFKKVSWDKCPQGFKEAGFPCYTHPAVNCFASVYTKENYMHLDDEIINKSSHLGKHFFYASDLRKHLNKFYTANKTSL
jgi:hypothetical protein